MLVDTGTNPHVIAGWVARKLHLGLRPLSESVSDHAGRAIKVYGVLNARASIDGWGAIDTGAAMVADFPEAIETMGIGAFVSPQALAAEGEGVVLDLYRHEMHSLPWEQAVRVLEAPGTPHAATLGGDHLRLCRDDSRSASGLTFVLPAVVAGHGAQLLLDTGAPNTDLLLTSRAGSSLLGQSSASAEPMYAASGLVRTRVVHEAHVKVGSWSVTTDVDLVPGSADRSCPRDGALSMDVLARCTLVLGRKALLGRCGP
jgi:predicted aspartyl protease